jgi:Co/Zn/Cd efflux system component
MRSAWPCTRNDVLGNLAFLLAALGVFGTGTGWPDTIVAAIRLYWPYRERRS